MGMIHEGVASVIWFAAKLAFIKVALSLKENVVYSNMSRRNICTTDTSDSLPLCFHYNIVTKTGW